MIGRYMLVVARRPTIQTPACTVVQRFLLLHRASELDLLFDRVEVLVFRVQVSSGAAAGAEPRVRFRCHSVALHSCRTASRRACDLRVAVMQLVHSPRKPRTFGSHSHLSRARR